MHVSAKKMAFTGLLAAFVAVLLTLSAVIESNSLFLIAAASFCVGIVNREWKMLAGATFLVASTLISLLMVPNKLYCFTYAAMGAYVLLSEFLWEKIAEQKNLQHRVQVLWLGRYVMFNCIYIPIVLFFQELLFVKPISGGLLWGVIAAGQVVLLVYEKAYQYFQAVIWGRLRMKLL